jgi:hypothetical protein
MLNKIKALTGSRKFWAGLLTVILTYANGQLKLLDDVHMASIAGIVGAWIIGQGAVDAASK